MASFLIDNSREDGITREGKPDWNGDIPKNLGCDAIIEKMVDGASYFAANYFVMGIEKYRLTEHLLETHKLKRDFKYWDVKNSKKVVEFMRQRKETYHGKPYPPLHL
jgi:hypothetical protein